jgi:phosphoribosylglycinamide formyltransferase-1
VLNLAIFVTGNGSNFRAIETSIREGRLEAAIWVVVSSSANAGALSHASAAGYATLVERKEDRAQPGYGERLRTWLSAHGVDFVALCGYLLLFPSEVVRAYPNRMTNIHPALLPAFGGKGMYGHHVHEAVLASGARYSGATVHIVTEEYDRGPIVAQHAVPVADDDTPETLAARVLTAEHQLYTEALQLFASGRIVVRGLRTTHRA